MATVAETEVKTEQKHGCLYRLISRPLPLLLLHLHLHLYFFVLTLASSFSLFNFPLLLYFYCTSGSERGMSWIVGRGDIDIDINGGTATGDWQVIHHYIFRRKWRVPHATHPCILFLSYPPPLVPFIPRRLIPLDVYQICGRNKQ